MHMGHVDTKCQENCDARRFVDLDEVSINSDGAEFGKYDCAFILHIACSSSILSPPYV